MDRVEEYYTLLNNQLFVGSGWNICHEQWRTQEFGLQLGAKDDGSSIGSAEHVLGEGGSGRHTNIWSVILISLYWYAAGI